MAVNRQQNLFAAEDWKIAYKAYSEIDFQAYDFDTIRGALVGYIQTNYPENFNDYIESSEFIAIVEMLAYLSQSLAFRMDVNTRENFLETAESRDSVFKLARMLGYNPKRNIPSSGLMKITSVKTTEPLIDSLGNDLNNRTVYWDDANNPNSYEQFITIMNAAMSKTNRFTSPIKDGTISGVSTELYQLNTPMGSPIVYNFDINVSGANKPFNIVNPDFQDNSHFYERHPDPTNLFNLIYRNDGNGISSDDTGFFTLFRQGTLEFTDFNYINPIENRLQDINVSNIGENDLYLQEINTSGIPLNKWARVPNTVGQTLSYNSTSLDTRNLYAVENVGTSGIRLRFTDGNFGNVPVGVFRFWHRVSDPTRYSIQPEEARNKTITIPYENAQGKQYALTVRMSLTGAVKNSLPAESLTAIKERAPQTYYTQNRMVSAQDYNVFPESQSTNITKIKATNKTHAGHSRYIDLNDPTGTFQNVDTFADDAFIYIDELNTAQSITVNSNTTPLEVATSIIPNALKTLAINNFVYYTAKNTWETANSTAFMYQRSDNVLWNPLPVSSKSNTGYISEEFGGDARDVLRNTELGITSQLKENTFVKWENPENTAEYIWARITNVENTGLLTAGISTSNGPWTMSEVIPAGWRLRETIVTLRKLFTSLEAQAVVDKIEGGKPFYLSYHLTNDAWIVNEYPQGAEVDATSEYAYSDSDPESYWLIVMNPISSDRSGTRYTMTMRGTNYVVQSEADLKFYNVKNVKVVDSTNKSSQDIITFPTTNTKPADVETYTLVKYLIDEVNTATGWENDVTNTIVGGNARNIDLPLKSRDITWLDLETKWKSKFGILLPDGSHADAVDNDRFVSAQAEVLLGTYKAVTGTISESNVTIGTNTGTITSIPNTINVPFNSGTFGDNIIESTDGTPVYLSYKHNGVYYKAIEGVENDGPLTLVSVNDDNTSGVIEFSDIWFDGLSVDTDINGATSTHELLVEYSTNKSNLVAPVKWEISDVYRESDGYTDPRKVKVAPLDTDGDLVPDRPRQFAELVGDRSLVLFEYYTDFDGYTYDRPVSGEIADYRRESTIVVNNAADTISPGSYAAPITLSTLNWVLVDSLAVAQPLINQTKASGLVVYAELENTVYQLTPESTTVADKISLLETTDYFVKRGRGKTQNTSDMDPSDCFIRWQHVAPNDVRIDPSISNIVEMVVLTTTYYDDVLKWQNRPAGEFPLEPTSDQLATEFTQLNSYKSASDTIVYRSAKFRLLFGTQAEQAYQAKFRVVKLSDQLSDNELKTRIITTMNEYFSINNWEFGETFYFTELSTYIHQKLGSAIGSIMVLPKTTQGKLGEMFQVTADPNELFINTATVNDIEIISRLDNQTLRTDR